MLQFGVRPVRIDIMNELAGLDFDEAYAKWKEVIWENIKINFIGLKDLLVSKKVAGRKQDEADIQKLKKVNRLKK